MLAHSFSFKPDSEGVVVTLSEETLASINQFQDADYLRPVFENAAVIDMQEDDEQRQQLQKYLALMRYEFGAANDAKFASLLLLVNLLLISIKRQVDFQAMGTANAPANLRTFAAFRRLVEKHFREHWQVADYATALNISTSTLNRMCHERFGSNAKSIIMARLIAEAKRRLVYTRQPLDQIAYYLGYRDPAYFSRVFKKLEQQSPGDYRRERQL